MKRRFVKLHAVLKAHKIQAALRFVSSLCNDPYLFKTLLSSFNLFIMYPVSSQNCRIFKKKNSFLQALLVPCRLFVITGTSFECWSYIYLHLFLMNLIPFEHRWLFVINLTSLKHHLCIPSLDNEPYFFITFLTSLYFFVTKLRTISLK
jgi:hypothetical protein